LGEWFVPQPFSVWFTDAMASWQLLGLAALGQGIQGQASPLPERCEAFGGNLSKMG